MKYFDHQSDYWMIKCQAKKSNIILEKDCHVENWMSSYIDVPKDKFYVRGSNITSEDRISWQNIQENCLIYRRIRRDDKGSDEISKDPTTCQSGQFTKMFIDVLDKWLMSKGLDRVGFWANLIWHQAESGPKFI